MNKEDSTQDKQTLFEVAGIDADDLSIIPGDVAEKLFLFAKKYRTLLEYKEDIKDTKSKVDKIYNMMQEEGSLSYCDDVNMNNFTKYINSDINIGNNKNAAFGGSLITSDGYELIHSEGINIDNFPIDDLLHENVNVSVIKWKHKNGRQDKIIVNIKRDCRIEFYIYKQNNGQNIIVMDEKTIGERIKSRPWINPSFIKISQFKELIRHKLLSAHINVAEFIGAKFMRKFDETAENDEDVERLFVFV